VPLHVGLERLANLGHGFTQVRGVSTDILMPGLPSASCNWLRKDHLDLDEAETPVGRKTIALKIFVGDAPDRAA
jgi:hypothetical protein